MIPQELIEEIRDKSDIVNVIGSVLDLKRTGTNYKTLCPFHNEKTPSFIVSPDKQIYHCFGCGKGGNVFHFLMEYEAIGFVEAVRKLGKEVGVDVDRYITDGDAGGKLDPYYHVMEFAAEYYRGTLIMEGGAAERARSYLEQRGIDSEMIETFGLGFADSGWDNFYKAASERGISKDILLELGLIIRSRGGSGYRDYFRNRILFPLESISNRVVGFAGRVLDKSEPKYLNSSESPIYSKRKILYGMNHARPFIKKSSTLIITEGYMDYLTLWNRGFQNICAVCGTALTESQAALIARYAKHVYIINDGDRAGIRAAVRAADRILLHGLDSRIVILPEDEDPDSFVRKRGAEDLRDLMNSAPDYFNYLKGEAERGSRPSYRKGQVIKHLLGVISGVKDDVGKELYLQEVSGLFNMPLESLRAGLKEKRGIARDEEPRKPEVSKRRIFQKQVFRVGLEDDSFAEMIIDNLIEGDLEGELFREYYKALDSAVKNNIDIKSRGFAGAIEDPDLSSFAAEIALMELPPGPLGEFLADTLIWLKRAALRDELKQMKKRLAEIQAESEEGISSEGMEIAEMYRKVAKELESLRLKEGDREDGS